MQLISFTHHPIGYTAAQLLTEIIPWAEIVFGAEPRHQPTPWAVEQQERMVRENRDTLVAEFADCEDWLEPIQEENGMGDIVRFDCNGDYQRSTGNKTGDGLDSLFTEDEQSTLEEKAVINAEYWGEIPRDVAARCMEAFRQQRLNIQHVTDDERKSVKLPF